MHAANAAAPDDARADVEAYYREVAPFYDAELTDRDDLDFWRSVASQAAGGRILELGAGSGRVTAELAPNAGLLVAVDLSPDLFRLAGNRLGRCPSVHFVRADMRTVALRCQFDLIVAANDPLCHVLDGDDRDRTLQMVARHLAPDGRFLLDALWFAPQDATAITSPGGKVRHQTSQLGGETLSVVERWRRRSGPGHTCHAAYEYRRPGRRTVTAEFDARDWTPEELRARFRRAGLVVTNVWGSYRREPWNPTHSSQLLVEARRA